MKYPTLALVAASLALVAPALAESPAMKAGNSMKMDDHDKMTGGMAMSGKKPDPMPMKPMVMKKDDGKPADGMSMKAGKDMKH